MRGGRGGQEGKEGGLARKFECEMDIFLAEKEKKTKVWPFCLTQIIYRN